MTESTLFLGISIFIILLIVCIHIYDKHLVKEIKNYEIRLEKKGIFKRHYINNKIDKKHITVKCKNCSKKFVVKTTDIPPSGRVVKCSYCAASWRQKPIMEN